MKKSLVFAGTITVPLASMSYVVAGESARPLDQLHASRRRISRASTLRALNERPPTFVLARNFT